jgi:hypothetical protein
MIGMERNVAVRFLFEHPFHGFDILKQVVIEVLAQTQE